jgi:hypothetical protein
VLIVPDEFGGPAEVVVAALRRTAEAASPTGRAQVVDEDDVAVAFVELGADFAPMHRECASAQVRPL